VRIANSIPFDRSLSRPFIFVFAAVFATIITAPAMAQSPGGSSTQVQYNCSGSFCGDADMTFDGTQTFTATKIRNNSQELIVGRNQDEGIWLRFDQGTFRGQIASSAYSTTHDPRFGWDDLYSVFEFDVDNTMGEYDEGVVGIAPRITKHGSDGNKCLQGTPPNCTIPMAAVFVAPTIDGQYVSTDVIRGIAVRFDPVGIEEESITGEPQLIGIDVPELMTNIGASVFTGHVSAFQAAVINGDYGAENSIANSNMEARVKYDSPEWALYMAGFGSSGNFTDPTIGDAYGLWIRDLDNWNDDEVFERPYGVSIDSIRRWGSATKGIHSAYDVMLSRYDSDADGTMDATPYIWWGANKSDSFSSRLASFRWNPSNSRIEAEVGTTVRVAVDSSGVLSNGKRVVTGTGSTTSGPSLWAAASTSCTTACTNQALSCNDAYPATGGASVGCGSTSNVRNCNCY
jgi:hypothetical protein